MKRFSIPAYWKSHRFRIKVAEIYLVDAFFRKFKCGLICWKMRKNLFIFIGDFQTDPLDSLKFFNYQQNQLLKVEFSESMKSPKWLYYNRDDFIICTFFKVALILFYSVINDRIFFFSMCSIGMFSLYTLKEYVDIQGPVLQWWLESRLRLELQFLAV